MSLKHTYSLKEFKVSTRKGDVIPMGAAKIACHIAWNEAMDTVMATLGITPTEKTNKLRKYVPKSARKDG